jgi:transcriptional regulator with XRE-family HTH domain
MRKGSHQLRSTKALRVAMEARNLSNRRLSQVTGLTYGTVSNLAGGSRPTCTEKVAHAIAAALRVDVDLLFIDTRAASKEAA